MMDNSLTQEQKREQCINFVYGNLRASGIEITKEQVAQAYDNVHSKD